MNINNTNRFEFTDGKTTYLIFANKSNKTTITIEKWVADILQFELSSVDEFIESLYKKIKEKFPNLTRKKVGNAIRQLSIKKANTFQATKKKILGWNDIELLQSLEVKHD